MSQNSTDKEIPLEFESLTLAGQTEMMRLINENPQFLQAYLAMTRESDVANEDAVALVLRVFDRIGPAALLELVVNCVISPRQLIALWNEHPFVGLMFAAAKEKYGTTQAH